MLGNDVAGTVEAVGAGVSRFAPGQRVFGLVATGKDGGAHASHVVVPQEQLAPRPQRPTRRRSPSCRTRSRRCGSRCARPGSRQRTRPACACWSMARPAGWGGWPCSCCTRWGSRVTAICGHGKREDCLALGALRAVERGPASIASLPQDFDVVLNFGSWDDELALASRLGLDALGHATTVHPLLANFDRLGWVRGRARLLARAEARAIGRSRAERSRRATAGPSSSPIARRSRRWRRDCASAGSRCR